MYVSKNDMPFLDVSENDAFISLQFSTVCGTKIDPPPIFLEYFIKY